MQSLRIRLILLLGAAIVVSAALQFAFSFEMAMRQANRLFDYHMQQVALALQDSSFSKAKRYGVAGTDGDGFDFVIQVWTENGAHVYQSRKYQVLPRQAVTGYSNVTLENGEWRTYALHTEKRVIQVAQKLDARRDRAIALTMHSLWPEIPGSILLIAAVWWVVTAALRPVNRIGRDLADRNADALAPVSAKGVPREVLPLVGELNSLLGRVELALQSQQRFVADAAHELRSPLTALRLQVQTLARAKDEAAREQAVQRLLGGVDRASRLVEQLLALARHDPSGSTHLRQPLSLPACLDQALADTEMFAASKLVSLDRGKVDFSAIEGDVDSVLILIRNLLDNAIRYTPGGGVVRIELRAEADHASLLIDDSGPGIPEAVTNRVFDRFYRVPGTSPTGSGLGLAIVKTIADRHGATISLASSSLGGLAVQVRFPVAANAVPDLLV
ncbi:MAG: ATP-binding protein [Pseudomonadota bacterium]